MYNYMLFFSKNSIASITRFVVLFFFLFFFFFDFFLILCEVRQVALLLRLDLNDAFNKIFVVDRRPVSSQR